jgi:hypothetical protein
VGQVTGPDGLGPAAAGLGIHRDDGSKEGSGKGAESQSWRWLVGQDPGLDSAGPAAAGLSGLGGSSSWHRTKSRRGGSWGLPPRGLVAVLRSQTALATKQLSLRGAQRRSNPQLLK